MQRNSTFLCYDQPFASNSLFQSNMPPMLLDIHETITREQRILSLLLERQKELQRSQYLRLVQQRYIQPETIVPRVPEYTYKVVLYPQEAVLLQNNDIDNCDENCDSDLNSFKVEPDLAVKKEEEGLSQSINSVPSVETSVSSQNLLFRNEYKPVLMESLKENEKSETDSYSRNEEILNIIRRNGFKQPSYERTRDQLLPKKRKSNKLVTPKRPPAKTKHLWINYGRRIIDFALAETTDDGKARIKKLKGKLSSKYEFEKVFGVKPFDSEEEKSFKVMFGQLALYFITFKADEAFKDSNYRDDLVSQKKVVSLFIQQLISR